MERRLNGYTRALQGLNNDIMKLGTLAKKCLTDAMEALAHQDDNKALLVIDTDSALDDLSLDIEHDAMELIALQQPLASELRVLAAVLRINRDLERIGDYAVNIAEITLKLTKKGEKYFKPLVDIPRMHEMVQKQIVDALDAYAKKDLELAAAVFTKDKDIDALFDSLHEELLGYMKENKDYVEQASYLALVARYLERAGDHAINIAEMVAYLIKGKRRYFKEGDEGKS